MKLLNNFYFPTLQRTEDNDSISYKVTLNPQHKIFEAHFPTQPITPGVCLMQMVSETLSAHLKQDLNVKSVRNIKFLHVLTPKEHVDDITIKFDKLQNTEDCLSVQATIEVPNATIAKLSLVYEPLCSHSNI